MARYKCEVCGWIYDEDKESKPFSALAIDWSCPGCGVDKTQFKKI